jgi:osmotically-inducible protein OsmY
MTTTLSPVDQSLREAVLHALEWSPEVNASLIAVTARDGIITLSGYADTYAAKLSAERAVRKVHGVVAIANELEVRLAHERIDPDIARDATTALRFSLNAPRDASVTVRDGHVTLMGTAEWMFEKVAAERAVKHLQGVRGVFNRIEIRPRVEPRDVQRRITEALHRHADIDARHIRVVAVGGVVTLSGSVRTLTERDEAERAAWAAPGVTKVENHVTVHP